ncbi:HAMP domain-containing methyl-accepting chemotaxis protein [Fluviispira vulneris]|uniref:HAMP domain-containing methyl-accepting chemotaxis protein n=1 Tax=Fluviispira vulneris TaxID=2763012 RepID=UPI0016485EFB|nr:methyl-accepting chemotaxis protein [Fluviispira vulneris]
MAHKSLAFKLYISVILLVLIILGSASFSIFMIDKTQEFANDTGDDELPSFHFAYEIQTGLGLIRRNELRTLASEEPKFKEANRKTLIKNHERIKELLSIYKKYVFDENEKKQLAQFEVDYIKYKEVSEKYIELSNAGNNREALKLMFDEGDALLKKLTDGFADVIANDYDLAIESTKRGANLTFITTLTMTIIIVLCLLISFVIFRLIQKSTRAISTAVLKLKDQSISTGTIASELKNGSASLSDAANGQAAAVHETTAAVNEITSMVNRTSENARHSNEVAKGAAAKAEEAQITMQRLVTAMDTIQESSSQLQNIADVIAEINTKTKVINDIVNKTELLSLNASIESARAGEHGKGFAVVADEVGKLAKVSGKSAKEIQQLIRKSQGEVNNILELTISRVTDGKKVTTEAQDSFIKISEDIINMTSVIQQISDATHEQEIGVRQISTAMDQIDRATQSCLSAVNTTRESSLHLIEQSNKLDQTAKDIEVLIMGSKA